MLNSSVPVGGSLQLFGAKVSISFPHKRMYGLQASECQLPQNMTHTKVLLKLNGKMKHKFQSLLKSENQVFKLSVKAIVL